MRLPDALGREVLRQAAAGGETSVAVGALAPGLCAAQWLDAHGRVLMSRRVAHE